MSAGEVERLVSELSGGTGGDEEEEWLYGGTELPVPSLSPGFSQASPPGLPTAGVPGPWRRRPGPLAQSLVRPDSGRVRRARPPPPSASGRPAHAPYAHPPRGGRSGLVRGRGSWPAVSPSYSLGLLGRLASALFRLFFNIASKLCWCGSSCPLTVGCPSCCQKQSFCNNS